MTYKQLITQKCVEYSLDDKARFIGYNTVKGSRMYGTLNGVSPDKCIETPVAENLMMGLAMGMAYEGFKPVVCFERHDFMLLSLDAIVNHLDKLPYLSGNQYKFPIIIRAIVGGTSPIDPGVQHTGDYTLSLNTMLKRTDVYPIAWWFEGFESVGLTKSGAVILIENKDMYEQQANLPNRKGCL